MKNHGYYIMQVQFERHAFRDMLNFGFSKVFLFPGWRNLNAVSP
jgi:hypothetical protein